MFRIIRENIRDFMDVTVFITMIAIGLFSIFSDYRYFKRVKFQKDAGIDHFAQGATFQRRCTQDGAHNSFPRALYICERQQPRRHGLHGGGRYRRSVVFSVHNARSLPDLQAMANG